MNGWICSLAVSSRETLHILILRKRERERERGVAETVVKRRR